MSELTARHRLVAVPHRRRSHWRTSLLAAAGDGSTRRRASDAVRLGVAVSVVGLAVAIMELGPHDELELAKHLTSFPSALQGLVTALWFVGSIGMIVALGVVVLVARRWHALRDAAVAGAGVWLVSGLLSVLLGADGGRPAPQPPTTASTGFPLVRTGAAVAVAVVLYPYLSRVSWRVVTVVLALSVVAAMMKGEGLPLDVLASVVLGWGVAAAVHLIFGSPSGLPSVAEVAEMADDLGVALVGVEPIEHQEWGVARFRARSRVDDEALAVVVYGRDAKDAELMAKVWRFLWYRDSGATLVGSRLQHVEHEAYLTLLAGRSGVVGPDVVAAGIGGRADDAVLITAPPPGAPLADVAAASLGPEVIDRIFGEVGELRASRLVHGGLNGETILIAPDGSVAFDGFGAASSAASDDRLDRDLASAMVATAAVVGPQPTVESVARVLGADALAGAIPQLQLVALDRVNHAAAHANKKLLGDLRTAASAAAGIDEPQLAEIHRVSWGSFAMGIGALVGVVLIVREFSGVDDLWSTLSSAEWVWVFVAFVIAQTTNAAQAFSVMGSVSTHLPFGPTLELEFANVFTGLVGGTVGTTATIIRFFQRRGLAVSVAVSSGVLVSLAGMLTQAVLFVVAFLITRGAFTFAFQQQGSGSSSSGSSYTWVLWLLLGAIALIGVVTGVPRFRKVAVAKLKPQVDAARANLRELAGQPRKLVLLFGGAAAAEVLFAMVLGASLHAYGGSASLGELLVINTIASLLGGVAPVPGGMGVIEAGLIAGFTAMGIPNDVAVATTLTSRLMTCYLPPIWGYPTLVHMRHQQYL